MEAKDYPLIQEFYKKGNVAEANFSRDLFLLANRKNIHFKLEKSCLELDKKHIDLSFTNFEKGVTRTIDVKALKKDNRGDADTDWKIVWIETVNSYGFDGWTKEGADYIALELPTKWLVIKRKELYSIAMKVRKEKGYDSIIYDSPKYGKKFYTYYTRGKDVFFKIRLSDLKGAKISVISKNNFTKVQ